MSAMWAGIEGVALAVLALAIAWIKGFFKKPEAPKSSNRPEQWRVAVESATLYNSDYAMFEGFGTGRETRPVEGQTAVVLRRGKERHPIGTVKVAADDFDEQLQKLIHKAEERASTLNAYGDGLL